MAPESTTTPWGVPPRLGKTTFLCFLALLVTASSLSTACGPSAANKGNERTAEPSTTFDEPSSITSKEQRGETRPSPTASQSQPTPSPTVRQTPQAKEPVRATHEKTAAVQVAWVNDSFTQPLPPNASKVRVMLPAPIDSILLGPQYRTQLFNAHVLERPEGVEVVALAVKPGTMVVSVADGVVTQVVKGDEYKGDQVAVDYGDGLSGRHHYLKGVLVKKGDKVRAGDTVGEAKTTDDGPPSIEFTLVDANRSDGSRTEVGNGQSVSLFDYLNEDLKKRFTDLYQDKIIKPHIAQGKPTEGGVTLWEPFLTNRVLVHQGNKGKLTGEWLLTSKWGVGGPPDVLTFLDVHHRYFDGRRVMGIDVFQTGYALFGEWEANYDKKQLKITRDQGTLYAIFDVDESGDRARLKLELQEGSFPGTFSSKAATYEERQPVSLYEQARTMRVLYE